MTENVAPEMTQFDFIIVGGGTAGCTVAGRLAESPDARVLVIEAGRADPSAHEEINTPARGFELRGSQFDWQYKTTFVDKPAHTKVYTPNTRGKVLGGSSCTHYHTWIPGSRGTYDAWAEYGGDDWTWDRCREYLYKSATYHDEDAARYERMSYIGQDGPINVSHAELVPEIEGFREALTSAWKSKGGQETEDIYSGTMRGLWKSVNSVWNGTRSSAWAYLEGKPNVTVLSETRSKRLLLEEGEADDGRLRCVGIEVILPSGETKSFRARREVVVASGVFESPKLLMLSGVGPADQLRQFDIPVRVDSPHVGQNLQDHPILPHVFKLKDGNGLDQHLLRAGLEKDAATSLYRQKRRGPWASPLLEMVGLPRIDEALERHAEYRGAKKAAGGKDPFGPDGQPHFEIDFVPMFADAFQWDIATPPSGDYLTVIVDLLRPLSRGRLQLRSSDPLEQMQININFFDNDLDLLAMREGVRWVDDMLLHGDGMKDLIEGEYPWKLPRASDAAMDDQILKRCQTGFHPCGSARMGKTLDQGVVDGRLRVHGVQGLRVVDASVIPLIPDCRIQMSVYMIGEKGADMVKADYPEIYSR